MRTAIVTTLLIASLGDSGGLDAADEPGLAGAWAPASAEVGGNKLPEATLKAMKLVLEDGKYTVTIGEAVDRGTVKRDASKTPRTMEITGTEGPNKGRTMLAIYELKGDSLRVCYDLTGKAYPAEFVAKAGDLSYFLVEYRRVKP